MFILLDFSLGGLRLSFHIARVWFTHITKIMSIMFFALSLNKENLSEACPSPDQHLPLGPCQLASRSVFMPARRVSARLFQTFHPHHLPADWSVCRPKSPPVQRAQWSLFWVAKLSGLIAPIGPTSLPDRGECLDRQILAAMHVKTSVRVVHEHTGVQTPTHTHPRAL